MGGYPAVGRRSLPRAMALVEPRRASRRIRGRKIRRAVEVLCRERSGKIAHKRFNNDREEHDMQKIMLGAILALMLTTSAGAQELKKIKMLYTLVGGFGSAYL